MYTSWNLHSISVNYVFQHILWCGCKAVGPFWTYFLLKKKITTLDDILDFYGYVDLAIPRRILHKQMYTCPLVLCTIQTANNNNKINEKVLTVTQTQRNTLF